MAAAYDRFRPDYPDVLAKLIEEYAGRPLETALEIGAGTGKATKTIVRHGVSVTASDPDAEMLAVLSDHLPDVRTIAAGLEELPPIGPFDLVYSAAALHWTEPEHRWQRIAELLVPSGVFASFGGAPYLADGGLEEASSEAQRPWLVDDSPAGPVETSDDGMHWPATELVASPLFTEVRETVVEQRLVLSRSEWLGYLSTVSAYLMLSADDRAAALDAVAAVLPDEVELTADLTLHLARRT